VQAEADARDQDDVDEVVEELEECHSALGKCLAMRARALPEVGVPTHEGAETVGLQGFRSLRVGGIVVVTRLPGGGTPFDAREVPLMTDTPSTRTRKSIWCSLAQHTYVKRTNDEGGRYLVCRRCGKEKFPPDSAGPRIVV
jgi:hypothetical protein